LAGAKQAREALEESVRLLKGKKIDAVVNGPVSKEWLARVGFRYPGQTEFYARRFGKKADGVTMCMVGPRLRVALVTTHVSLRRAVAGLTASAIVRAGLHLAELLRRMGIRKPRIAVCGLNPHAGEGGLFGEEDKKIVAPAVRQLRRKSRLSFSGPEPADTVFRRAMQGDYDGVVALYHDQGLIPAKLLDFDRTVNVTMGLPVIRCSPDHGTAFGIAGKRKARVESMLEAVKLACRLVGRTS
jgi:4-hydroxythreonine-4-phosphate dehydrogenase